MIVFDSYRGRARFMTFSMHEEAILSDCIVFPRKVRWNNLVFRARDRIVAKERRFTESGCGTGPVGRTSCPLRPSY
jgi:hypothetical protein